VQIKSPPTAAKIADMKRWMRQHVHLYTQYGCSEIDTTALAEAAACTFSEMDMLSEDDIFEWAHNAATAYENSQR
jgi:hypothetical protein